MLPVKDDVSRKAFPYLTAAAIALGAGAWLGSLLGGGWLLIALDLGALAIFGPGVEWAIGRARLAGLILIAGAACVVAQALIWQGAGATLSGPGAAILAASGSVAAVVGAYVALRPAGRIFTLVPAPWFSTVVAIPAVVIAGVWVAAQAVLGGVGVAEPAAASGASAGAAWLIHLGALPLGAALARPLAVDRPIAEPPPAGRVAAR